MSLGSLFVIIGLVLAIVSIFVATTVHLLAFAVISIAVGVLVGTTPFIRS
jgi:hypothetical protein